VPPDTYLRQRIKSHEAGIAIIGLGYVGLPLAMACATNGFRVIGIDTDRNRVAQINDGNSQLNDVPSAALADLVSSGKLKATRRYRDLHDCQIAIICVPTPLNKTKDPDLSHVVDALRQTRDFLQRGQLVVLESTTYPGFTREVALPILEESGFTCGKDFFLAFSPERTDPGNAEFTVINTPKILGGATSTCAEVAKELYEKLIEKIHVVSSTDAAEMTKLLENTFRAVNIGLVNEVALMCQHLGIDTWEVIEAASTKPFGYMPFYPGPGLGGHCIPVDPLYLSWKLRSHNYTARFIELAQTVNASMPSFVVSLVADALNDQRKPVSGARIIVLGVSYKPDVADIRESPALAIMAKLSKKGAHLAYCDPYVPEITIDGQTFTALPLDEAVVDCDAVVITTDHTAFDLKSVVAQAPLIIDTRNATRRIQMSDEEKAKVVKL
jgi:UDP-N-acetyl-D-glucosamine dehydrogenase